MKQEIKAVLNRNKVAFRIKDKEEMKSAQREVKHCLREAKDSFGRKLNENNMREIWDGVKTITGHNTKTRVVGGIVWEYSGESE